MFATVTGNLGASARRGAILASVLMLALVPVAVAKKSGGSSGHLKLSGYWSGKLTLPAHYGTTASCLRATGFDALNGKAGLELFFPTVKLKVDGKTTKIKRLTFTFALPKFGGKQTLVAPTADGAGTTQATLKMLWGNTKLTTVGTRGGWDQSGTVTTARSGKSGSVNATVEVYSNVLDATGPKGQFKLTGSWKGCSNRFVGTV